MNKSESHYLNCLEPNCEMVYCVDRRMHRDRIDRLERANGKLGGRPKAAK